MARRLRASLWQAWGFGSQFSAPLFLSVRGRRAPRAAFGPGHGEPGGSPGSAAPNRSGMTSGPAAGMVLPAHRGTLGICRSWAAPELGPEGKPEGSGSGGPS